MLHFLRRHHTTLWIVVTVVVIISFIFFGAFTKTGSNLGGRTPDDNAFTIYGRDYSFSDMDRLKRGGEITMTMELYEFGRAISSYSAKIKGRGEKVPAEFVFNRIVLRREMENNGIEVSDAEVKEEFKKLPAFQANGAFDATRAEMFEQRLGSIGMRSEDALDVVRDVIGLRKLQQVVAGNYVASPLLAEKFYDANYQTIKTALIPFALADFKKTVQVSDDEIKKYFDQEKEKFKTPEKRTVSYVAFPKPKDLEKLSVEDRLKKTNEFSEQVNNFSVATLKAGANFDEAAKAAKLEIKTVPAFSSDTTPDVLKDEFKLHSEVLRLDAAHPTSDPVDGKDAYFVAHLITVEKPMPQELKDVQEKIKDVLVAQKAQEAMMKAASDARKNIETALQAQKKFEEITKELNLTPQMLADFSPSEPLKELSNGNSIAGETQKLAAGKLTKPLPTENGVVLVYVIAKELRKRPDATKDRELITKELAQYTQDPIFRAWFEKRKTEAKLNADQFVRHSAGVF